MTTVKEIAAIFGLEPSAARALVKRGIFRKGDVSIAPEIVTKMATGKYSAKEAAKMCGVDSKTVARWLAEDKLVGDREDQHWRVSCKTVIALLGPWFGDDMLTPEKAAQLLGRKSTTLGKFARKGGVPYVQFPSGSRRYPRSALKPAKE